MAVFLFHGKVPVRLQWDASCTRGNEHVDVADNDNAEQYLAGSSCPIECEEVNV